jgi:hypothetical protein
VSTPLRELLAEHRRLESLLMQHQVHLVERRPAAARTAWQAFGDLLLGHIRAEEEVVLPEYEARVTPRRGGEADIFRREHRRLQRFVAEVSAWLDAWGEVQWPTDEVICLVERQKTLKEILEHHDQREGEHLYGGLEKSMAAADQQALLEGFRAAEMRGTGSDSAGQVPDDVPAGKVSAAAAAEQGPGAGPAEPDPGGVPAGSGQAGAALLAAAWLMPLYDELLAGLVRPRADAPWADARRRLDELSRTLQAVPPTSGQAELIQEMADLLDEVTPMKCFPASRGSQVHACWQLLQAARRAAIATAGTNAA